MVNAGLYRSFYTNPNLITDSNPLLINPYNQLPEDFVPRALEQIDDSGRLAAPEAISRCGTDKPMLISGSWKTWPTKACICSSSTE